MHPRGPSTALFLAMIVLIAGLLAGCGGGDQSGSGSQQNGGSQAKQDENAPKKQGGNAPKQRKNAPEKKILFGIVRFVNPKTEGFSVHPRVPEQGKKPVVFRLAQQTKITLEGKKAKLEDMKKGQQAQVEYIVRNDRNRALTVRLFEGGGGSQDDRGAEKTG
jgi:hypothetical protein